MREMGSVAGVLFETLPSNVIRHLQVIKPMATLLIEEVSSDQFSSRILLLKRLQMMMLILCAFY